MSAAGDHDRWADSAGAYVLGALPPEELGEYAAHLQACAACRAEVDELQGAADLLPRSAPVVAPPAALKARLMAEVEREAELLAAAGARADRPQAPAAHRRPERERRRLRWPSLVPGRLAAGLVAAALLIGVVAGRVAWHGGDAGRTVRAQVDQTRARGATAELDVRGRDSTLVAQGLPAPAGGKVYQVWIKRPGHAPEPTATLFQPRHDGSATASVPGSLDGVEAVLVTAEPPGGSPAPTSAPIVAARLS